MGPSFRHDGDAGDVIYGLATMKALGGGDLRLGVNRKTRVTMGEKSMDLLRELLLAQPYVKSVDLHWGEQVTYDLNLWRWANLDKHNPMQTLADRHMEMYPWLDRAALNQRWIHKIEALPMSKVVIHRSERYQNPLFPWKKILQHYGERVAFIGLESEHAKFQKEFGKVWHYPTANFMEVAQVIAGSKLFIGNQSCPYAIAEGMKHNTIQETWLKSPDCMFPRGNAQYVVGARVELPEV